MPVNPAIRCQHTKEAANAELRVKGAIQQYKLRSLTSASGVTWSRLNVVINKVAAELLLYVKPCDCNYQPMTAWPQEACKSCEMALGDDKHMDSSSSRN